MEKLRQFIWDTSYGKFLRFGIAFLFVVFILLCLFIPTLRDYFTLSTVFVFLAAPVFSVVGPRVTTSSDRFWRGVAIVVFAFNLVKTLLKIVGFELFN